MESVFAIDLISDLYLKTSDVFEWEDKPTSLFCVIAGNLSDDLDVVDKTLNYLSKIYRGVFYVEGALEHSGSLNYKETIDEIYKICAQYSNVVYLHNHVIIMNNIAIMGINGWMQKLDNTLITEELRESLKLEDISYLATAVKNMIKYRDVRKIAVFSSSIPTNILQFNQVFDAVDSLEPIAALRYDIRKTIKLWGFGGTSIVSDTILAERRFSNNPYDKNRPYWPKRLDI